MKIIVKERWWQVLWRKSTEWGEGGLGYVVATFYRALRESLTNI